MSIYPWVTETYHKLLANYRAERIHHTLLLIGPSPVTQQQLLDDVVQTLLCTQSSHNQHPCYRCADCLLFEAKTHPDFYRLAPAEKAKKIGVEQIRELTQVVLQQPQRGDARFVMIPEISTLTESAANALLKLIEEPPANSYFILTSHALHAVLATIRSRCLVINLPTPNTVQALTWLETQLVGTNLTRLEIETALLLNNGAPECALTLLASEQWQIRQDYWQLLDSVLKKRTFLELLSYCNKQDALLICYWLGSLFLDINKYQQKLHCHLVNQDQQTRVAQFATLGREAIVLNQLAEYCFQAREKMMNIQGINQELLFVELFIQIDTILFNQGK